MVEIRRVRQNEMNQAVALADGIFREEDQISMQPAFPAVFSPALGQSYGAFEDGRLLSFVGLVPHHVRIGSAKLNVCSIGAVCTHPDARGKGYASLLLDAVKSHADQSGASLLLISGSRSLYTRNDCFFFGSLVKYMIDGEHLPAASASSGFIIREMGGRDWYRLHRLAESRPVAYAQSLSELAELIHAEAFASCLKMRHKVIVAEEPGKDGMAAYAVIAVPDDRAARRTPFVVEWGGSAEAAAVLFGRSMAMLGLATLTVTISWHEREMHTAMEGLPYVQEKNYGTVHIVNAEQLVVQLQPYLQQFPEAAGLRISARSNGDYSLSLPGGEGASLGKNELVDMLFQPEADVGLETSLRASLSRAFPIPFPHVAGLNYV